MSPSHQAGLCQPTPHAISLNRQGNHVHTLSRHIFVALFHSTSSSKESVPTIGSGVNDVWHGTNGVPLDRYQQNITQMVEQCRAAGAKVMILAATMIGEDQSNT